METIQVNISTQLAHRLRSHYGDLARILELGLRQIEETPSTKPTPADLLVQRQVIAVLEQAGVVGPTPEVTAQYLAKRSTRSWKPIVTSGPPASQMIIEERDAFGNAGVELNE